MAAKKQRGAGKNRVWLSYDLGLRGNYDALYEWLDSKEARECGSSLATFETDKTREQIKKELAEIIGEDKKARTYLITGKAVGTFLLGSRKAAPWAGYFVSAVESAIDR